MNHVESDRLFELAEMPAIVDEPEWKHIKNCKMCAFTFVQFKVIVLRAPEDAGLAARDYFNHTPPHES